MPSRVTVWPYNYNKRHPASTKLPKHHPDYQKVYTVARLELIRCILQTMFSHHAELVFPFPAAVTVCSQLTSNHPSSPPCCLLFLNFGLLFIVVHGDQWTWHVARFICFPTFISSICRPVDHWTLRSHTSFHKLQRDPELINFVIGWPRCSNPNTINFVATTSTPTPPCRQFHCSISPDYRWPLQV